MKNLLIRGLFLGGCMIYLLLLGNASGAPTGVTGAPGEETCGRSSCHATAPNTGTASINLQLDNNATAYIPGEIHTLTVAINNAQNAVRNGFEMVALDAQNNNIGEWLIMGEYLQTKSANGRNYVTHSEDGSILTAWNIGWKAPSSNVGAVTFYLAVNDANDDGGRTGDNIYTTSRSFNVAIASSIKGIDGLENISVFPNPVTTQLNIQLNLATATNLSGTLVNAAGQSITALFHRILPVGDTKLAIPFPIDLPAGHYFLKLENLEGGVKSIPLLKM